jgi:hypothetical protein
VIVALIVDLGMVGELREKNLVKKVIGLISWVVMETLYKIKLLMV